MAAFSYQHQSFLLDPPVFLPNTPIKMSPFLDEPNISACFPQFHPPKSLHHIPFDVSINHESSCLANGTKVALSNNEPSVTNKHSTNDSSTGVDKPESGQQVTQKKKNRDGSSLTSVQSMDAREVRGKRQRKCNSAIKDDKEKKPKVDKNKDQKKAPEEVPTGYIHVRARRGQATDSHSLAERVRREKISERMKLLQSLVPGCDKVTGKALILDEIINYVQSLQNQVEFLSLKIAAVNPMFYDFGMDLDTFRVTPEGLDILASPLPNVQQYNPAQATAFSDITTPNSYPLMDSSVSSLLFDQEVQRPNILPQGNGQLLWDVDDQRQKLINQSGFSNNLCYFH